MSSSETQTVIDEAYKTLCKASNAIALAGLICQPTQNVKEIFGVGISQLSN